MIGPYMDDFDSIGGVIFGKMDDGRFAYNDDSRNPSIEALNQYQPALFGKVRFSSDVLLIRPFAGLNYDYFQFANHKLCCMVCSTLEQRTHRGAKAI